MKGENQIIGFVKWLLKWLLIVILGLIVLALGIWGATYAYQYWTHDRHLNNIEVQVFNGANYIIDNNKEASKPWEKYQNKVNSLNKESLKDSPKPVPEKICSEDMPIFVSYKNNTSKVIEYIEIDFQARLPEHSSNILDWSAELESDLIVSPGKTATYCAKLPVKEQYQDHENLHNAIYESKIVRARFQNQ